MYKKDTPYVSTTNACKLCTPLGATLAYKGVRGAIPFLHGSQGCATYMRRYIISHFREPMDIASSSLGENNAIHGGGPNLKKGLINVMQKYEPKLIGVATTCLTETIGDDVRMILHEFHREFGDLPLPEVVHCSTPSYNGTHMDGWHAATASLVDGLTTERVPETGKVCVLPNLCSSSDLRHIKALCKAFGQPLTLLPDYSETLDGQALEDYEKIASGGTEISAIRALSGARATIEFGQTNSRIKSAGTILMERFGVPVYRMEVPIGLRHSDAFMDTLEELSGNPMTEALIKERGRYVDAMVDGHKYVFGKRCIVYGEEDLVVGITAFLAEIGVHPVLVATGEKNKTLEARIKNVCDGLIPEMPAIREGVDFHEIAEEAATLSPDLMVGHSKGYKYAREWNIPLVRVGFPIHDRFGGQRILHYGYRGAQALYDRIVNAVLEKKQADSTVGYGYL